MKLYFATKKEDADGTRIAVFCRHADELNDSYRINEHERGIHTIAKSRVGIKHDVCAVGFSKEEAVMLYFAGIKEMAEFLEKKAEGSRSILSLPVVDES